jgi:hypothetical protein
MGRDVVIPVYAGFKLRADRTNPAKGQLLMSELWGRNLVGYNRRPLDEAGN